MLRAEVKIDPELDQDSRIDEVLSVVADARESAKGDGYTVAIAGIETTFREVNVMVEEDFGRILFISLGIGLVILLLAFRSVVAAAIPLGMAIGAITIANGIAALASQSYALNESYTEMILLLGLAVGIDYSLFIVSVNRQRKWDTLEGLKTREFEGGVSSRTEGRVPKERSRRVPVTSRQSRGRRGADRADQVLRQTSQSSYPA